MDQVVKTEWCIATLHEDSMSIVELDKKDEVVAHLCMEKDEALTIAHAIIAHFTEDQPK